MVKPVNLTWDSGCLARDEFLVKISDGDYMLIYIFVIYIGLIWFISYIICDKNSFTGKKGPTKKFASLPTCGFVAQLVERPTSIWEARVQAPSKPEFFSGFFFCNFFNYSLPMLPARINSSQFFYCWALYYTALAGVGYFQSWIN